MWTSSSRWLIGSEMTVTKNVRIDMIVEWKGVLYRQGEMCFGSGMLAGVEDNYRHVYSRDFMRRTWMCWGGELKQ